MSLPEEPPPRPQKPPPKPPGDPPKPKIKDPPPEPRGGDRPGETPVELPPRDPTLRKVGPEDEDRRLLPDEKRPRGISP
ncbi:hypothetical protein [Reyranella sp. CPCC 100927]|uniref:hypothetical protein n=1 Tax=Reyranella sp. CPCC 100927 TaxID=2599616 RepID=UPI0015B4BF51|nr:hypothetical protein [Reyranella sp. CPCC 100927]